jgi:hypothetical protein
MADALEGWTDFNVAMVGATAALAGLIIVAMSVNISTIMTSATLPARAATSIATLVLAIVAGAFGLIPGQGTFAYGVEVLVATLIAGVFQAHAINVIMKQTSNRAGYRLLQSLAGLLPLAAFLTGSVLVVAGAASAGLVALAFGSVLAVISAIIIAWVVLVEVLR